MDDIERNTADQQEQNRVERRRQARTEMVEQIKQFKRFMLTQSGSRAEQIHAEALADLVLKERFGD